MVEHKRFYQHIFGKTNVTLAAAAGTTLGVAAARCIVRAASLFGETTEPVNLKTAESRLHSICPHEGNSTLPAIKAPIENKDIDISVIIPVHNGEKHIRQCLESIFGQTGNFSLQVIAIDDRSTDLTRLMLEEAQKKYPFEIFVAENGGSAGRARNEGLRHATGKYLMFVDSDDILPPDAINRLYEEILYTKADIVQGSWKYLQEDDKGSIQFFWPHKLTHPARNADMMQIPGVPWGKIYKRELFDGTGFSETVPCYEDIVIHGVIFDRAKDIRTIANVVYEWRQNPEGLTFTTQGTGKGIYSYWSTKELVNTRKELGAATSDFWYRNLILQLSCYCYPCVRGMSIELQKKVFDACRALYFEEAGRDGVSKRFRPSEVEHMAARSLETGNFDAWKMIGKLYSLLM